MFALSELDLATFAVYWAENEPPNGGSGFVLGR
jgi:hypothetical protein